MRVTVRILPGLPSLLIFPTRSNTVHRPPVLQAVCSFPFVLAMGGLLLPTQQHSLHGIRRCLSGRRQRKGSTTGRSSRSSSFCPSQWSRRHDVSPWMPNPTASTSAPSSMMQAPPLQYIVSSRRWSRASVGLASRSTWTRPRSFLHRFTVLRAEVLLERVRTSLKLLRAAPELSAMIEAQTVSRRPDLPPSLFQCLPGPRAGAWLTATPASIDTHIPSPLFWVALQRRLRMLVWDRDSAYGMCGEVLGDHSLSCCGGDDRVFRHNAVRNIVCSAVAEFTSVSPELEKPRAPAPTAPPRSGWHRL